ncbi:MAG: 50S ribosome-binding GTPase [Thermodesulfovibrionales bacterium]
MPANLPPEYFEAEKRFKEASSPAEKISSLEALIATVPKHKGTDKLRADLRRRLSKLREEAQKKKKSGKGALYSVPREGAAQAALVGFANSGKSSLLAALTNAHPAVADYPMTTVMPLPGMMPYEDIQYQLVDLPPIGNESTDGWVSGILRVADMLIVVIDLTDDPEVQAELLLDQLSQWNIPAGGDKKCVIAANKTDASEEGALDTLRQRYGALCPVVGVSALRGDGMEELRQVVFRASDIIRIYSKEPGKEPDLAVPFTLPAGSTVMDLTEAVHRDFTANLRYACVWGSGKFPGQRVPRDHVLHDGDIVELHI